MLLLPRGVKDGDHQQGTLFFIHSVDHAIGETGGVSPPDVQRRVADGTDQRARRDLIPGADDFLHELASETFLTPLIPFGGFPDIQLDLWTKLQFPVYAGNAARSFSFIASYGMAVEESLSCSARRFLTKSSSAALIGGSSSSMARRTKNCRSATVKAGNSART